MFSQSRTDSLLLDEVTVLGSPLSRFMAGTQIKKIQTSDEGSLQQGLAQTTAYLKNYGNSQLSSLSLRGTSAQHTQVIWNGIPTTSPALGQSDFSIYPMFFSNQILLQKGSGSSYFGSGAVGGSIIIENSDNIQDSTLSVFAHLGSFQQVNMGANVPIKRKNLYLNSKIYYKSIENNFPIKIGTETLRQPHAQVKQVSAAQKIRLPLKRHTLFSEINFSQNNRNIQPAILSASRNHLLTQNIRWMASDNIALLHSHHYISTAFQFEKTVFNHNSTTQSQQLSFHYYFESNIGQKLDFKTGLFLNRAWIQSSNYERNKHRNTYHIFNALHFQPRDNVKIAGNFRGVYSNKWVFAPSLGYEWVFWKSSQKQLRLKGQWSTGYRMPTFNDLYWNPGGNPNLKPEKSNNFESGLQWQVGRNILDIQGYYCIIDSWIQWNVEQDLWTPTNLQKVSTRGIEVNYQTYFQIRSLTIKTQIEYEYVRAHDHSTPLSYQLPYVPQNVGNIFIKIQRKRTYLSTHWKFTDARYTTLLNNSTNRLDPFHIVNISFHHHFFIKKKKLNLDFTLHNVLNTHYQNVLNIAMPGIHYHFGLSFQNK